MSEQLTGEDLLERVARQDVAALGELYDRYAPRAYGLMVHILSSRGDAEEILQEVFVRLWSESPSLSQAGASVAAWLVVTARQAALDRLRAQGIEGVDTGAQGPTPHAVKARRAGTRSLKSAVPAASAAKSRHGRPELKKPREGDEPGPSRVGPFPPAWLPPPEATALIDDRLVLLQKVLDQLPKPQRQALELAVFKGLQESEIAAAMGEPLGKVRSSLRAAVTFVRHRRRAVCGTWAADI
jgi:RNA polymerase sigma-70 factor (ECF subfamily)